MATDQRLSANTIRQLAAQYPDWDPESVVRIAWRESNFVPTVIADDSDDLSYGLMQLNMKPGTADIDELRKMYGITRNEELLNPVVNIRAAHALWLAGGKSFIPGWKYVPPVANYPTTGGSTSIPNTDDQGNPNPPNVDVNGDGTPDVYIKDWTSEDATNWATLMPMFPGITPPTATAQGQVPQSMLNAMNFGTLPNNERATSSQKSTIRKVFNATTTTLGLWDSVTEVGSAGVDQFTDWAQGLAKLLSVLTSLSFWKKVGVGALALLLVLGGMAMFNKEKIMPVITKGTVK